MKIFLDGDAFPNLLKPVLYRAIERLSIKTVVISNKLVNIGQSELIEYLVVATGPDEADNRIVEMVEEDDLVITMDMQFAERVVTKRAYVLNHYGKFFDEENIKQTLAVCDLLESVRDTNIMTKGHKPFRQKDVHKFACTLNNFLNRSLKSVSVV